MPEIQGGGCDEIPKPAPICQNGNEQLYFPPFLSFIPRLKETKQPQNSYRRNQIHASHEGKSDIDKPEKKTIGFS